VDLLRDRTPATPRTDAGRLPFVLFVLLLVLSIDYHVLVVG
jgi:hypothetical protein